MSNRFYMLCTRETVGSNASFHCHNGNGYSSNIDRAHVYTQEEAQSSGWLIPGASWTPTHWMPLPAAPQEPKP
ncbi:DUF551 domain-containing protein [Klebsiella pneumoniae]|uniref:DUF551 domain-containing protein n=1 Tax=Klebsiella pneumoniae TaxID=573 RepID=UPI00141A63C7|nr:DUF551 domain-containing protein [Klebsiella pneumoniae]NIA86614.1 DUF551 domain-containing protein [Klebsiella pneumoniae]CAE7651782.1 hypothetical protein AI2779V1_1310 [Klebsiella pneumoniae]CAE7738375.1 hypothetical protein AI2793V1_1355 [Klebsiella pneumoniae]CAH3589556.1 hypothetical protein AI2793V1_1355 [Klebsiella pneumoniae]CAH3656345.1 hypothetical protein AI2779V1_1310 [Klebsiella pneumoniae]